MVPIICRLEDLIQMAQEGKRVEGRGRRCPP